MSQNNRRKVRKARIVPQTQFDRQLMRLESVVSEFSDWLAEAERSPADRESIAAKLWAIRSQQFPQVVHSLEWAMKKAMMRAFPLEENGL